MFLFWWNLASKVNQLRCYLTTKHIPLHTKNKHGMLFAQMSFYKTYLSKLQEYRAPFREKPRNDSPL